MKNLRERIIFSLKIKTKLFSKTLKKCEKFSGSQQKHHLRWSGGETALHFFPVLDTSVVLKATRDYAYKLHWASPFLCESINVSQQSLKILMC